MSQKNSRSEREPKSNCDKQKTQLKKAGFLDGGSDEARTRDPMRDRHVF